MTMPELPYEDADGEKTAGWSGSDTSHERAQRDVLDGTASQRQKRALDLVTIQRGAGMTWHELSAATGEHHGQVSGVLSVLHQTGRLARLTERRRNSLVYVNPHYVAGRALSPYRKRKAVVPDRPLTLEEQDIYTATRGRADRTEPENARSMVCMYATDLRILLDVVKEHL